MNNFGARSPNATFFIAMEHRWRGQVGSPNGGCRGGSLRWIIFPCWRGAVRRKGCRCSCLAVRMVSRKKRHRHCGRVFQACESSERIRGILTLPGRMRSWRRLTQRGRMYWPWACPARDRNIGLRNMERRSVPRCNGAWGRCLTIWQEWSGVRRRGCAIWAWNGVSASRWTRSASGGDI